MYQLQNRKCKISPAVSAIIILMVLLAGVILAALSDAQISGMIMLIFLIILCYYTIFMRIRFTSEYETILCDSRFYVFTAILMYSVLPPIYCLLTLSENGGARVRTANNATIYTPTELLQTLIMSLLLFIGIMAGIIWRNHVKDNLIYQTELEEDGKKSKKLFTGWLVVCVISTILFLLPFIRGGFKIIQMGGSILDVDRSISNSFFGRIQELFFSPEIMTASTIAMLFYGFQLEISQRMKRFILVGVVLFQLIIAMLTTRRARAISIILCAFVIYVYWHQKKKNKLPVIQITITIVAFLFLYFLEVFMGSRQTNGTSASFFQLFDGISAYDSLLQSTRDVPSLSMLGNVVYGLFRPIPILGKYIIELFGMPTDAAPLYHWMAERYTTYQLGGGLAYTPQLEAYLSGGYFGCFFFGIFYGYIFGKRRKGLRNVFVIAMAFSIARGTLQVVGNLIWPFGFIGYYFYDRFLFRRIRINDKSAVQHKIYMK